MTNNHGDKMRTITWSFGKVTKNFIQKQFLSLFPAVKDYYRYAIAIEECFYIVCGHCIYHK